MPSPCACNLQEEVIRYYCQYIDKVVGDTDARFPNVDGQLYTAEGIVVKHM